MSRRTQAERRERTRAALLAAAARGLSRSGYGNLVLEDVAREAGYTRGALYHQFAGKEELVLATLRWVNETWQEEVGRLADRADDPVGQLLALARGHAIYCRRDVARFGWALRIEFASQDHRVAREIERITEGLVERCARLIRVGRREGTIPAGPPVRPTALAVVGAIEGAVVEVAGRAPHDEELAARATAGILGVDRVR